MLTGSDSAPAKANEAKQKNDIGAAKDDVAIAVQNAQTDAYETVYVKGKKTDGSGEDVTAGGAAAEVSNYVKAQIFEEYKDTKKKKVGLASIVATSDGKISISTTDFEETGTIAPTGGTLSWGTSGGSSNTYAAYSIGQEVTVGTGANAQEFYVLEASDATQSTVTLLAKYNLSTTATNEHYMQAPNASYEETNCKFSTTKYWATSHAAYTNWSIEKLNLNNEPIPTTGENAETLATNAILKAQDYAATVSGTDGRLLTYEEAEKLKTSYSDMIWGTANANGTDGYFLYYWLGSGDEGNDITIRIVDGEDEGIYYTDFAYGENGVRPVITISKSLVNLSE